MLVGFLILLVLLVLGLLSLAFGVDSRDTAADPRNQHYLYGIR